MPIPIGGGGKKHLTVKKKKKNLNRAQRDIKWPLVANSPPIKTSEERDDETII